MLTSSPPLGTTPPDMLRGWGVDGSWVPVMAAMLGTIPLMGAAIP